MVPAPRAPSLPNRTETARPMPRLPPATSADLPVSVSMRRGYVAAGGWSTAARMARGHAVHHVRGDRGQREEHAGAAPGGGAGTGHGPDPRAGRHGAGGGDP